MVLRHFNLIIILFIIPFYFFGQSFIATEYNDTIYSENFYITDDYFKYTTPGNDAEKKLEIEKVKGYYASGSNRYYEKKLFNAKKRVGFLNLKLKKQNYFDFVELIFDGKIKAYRGVDYKVDTNKMNYWFFEKGDSLQITFNADFNKGSLKLKNSRYYNLNQDFIEAIFSDDEKVFSEIKELKKNGKLNQIRNIINDYNNRHYKKKNGYITTESMSYVTFLRDSKKELKEDLVLQINDNTYNLPRNSKLKVKMPSESNTMVCFKNSENDYCRLMSSSRSFPKFFKLILNKDNEGDIFKINGHSSFYKVRLENYKTVY